jgi:hypothetical protein
MYNIVQATRLHQPGQAMRLHQLGHVAAGSLQFCFSFFAGLRAKRPKIHRMSASQKRELYDQYSRIRAERMAILVMEMYAVHVFEEAFLAEDIRMAGVLCATCGAESSRAEPSPL